MRRTVGLVALLVVACSSDHPPFINDHINGGTHGTSHAGTSGEAPSDGAAGERAASSGGRTGAGGNSGRAGGNSGGAAGESEPDAADAGAGNSDLSAFNPWDVYIFGTVNLGVNNGGAAVALWSNPNYYVGGFSQRTDENLVHLLNGNLLYGASGVGRQGWAIFQFVPDLTYVAGSSARKYPEKPEANDIALTTEPCQSETRNFLTSPDGRLIYECEDKIWYEDGEPLWDHQEIGTNIIAFGYDGLVLLDANLTVMDLATGQRQTPDGFEQIASVNSLNAVRAVKGGFHVVVRTGTSGDGRELWSLSSHAVAKKLGVFPAPPNGVNRLGYPSRLSAWDELFESGSAPQSTQGPDDDLIVLRTIDGTSEIVYTTASQPSVRRNANGLFTGP